MISKIKKEDINEVNELLININGQVSLKDIENENKLIYVYKENNKVKGAIYVSVYYERSELDYIIVDCDLLGTKVASDLFNHVLLMLKDKGVLNITLEVNETNLRAIEFYKKHCFCEVARRKGYYKDKDALLMERVI